MIAEATKMPAREALLDATLRVIADKGLDAVTHRKVAAIANVSLGTVTHHFDGRLGLLREAFKRYVSGADDLLEVFQDTSDRTKPAGPATIRSVMVRLLEREFADPTLVRAEYELILFASKDPELASIVIAWEKRFTATIAELLEQAGAPKPVEGAKTLGNFLRGFELERLLRPTVSRAEFERRLNPLLSVICAPQKSQRDKG